MELCSASKETLPAGVRSEDALERIAALLVLVAAAKARSNRVYTREWMGLVGS